jgi:hypothetical protein
MSSVSELWWSVLYLMEKCLLVPGRVPTIQSV